MIFIGSLWWQSKKKPISSIHFKYAVYPQLYMLLTALKPLIIYTMLTDGRD